MTPLVWLLLGIGVPAFAVTAVCAINMARDWLDGGDGSGFAPPASASEEAAGVGGGEPGSYGARLSSPLTAESRVPHPSRRRPE